MIQLEIACFSAASAVIAQQSGAHRIELCAQRWAGGITPDFSVFAQVKAQVEIPVYVMIRPRGGNFCYASAEFELMKQQLMQFKQAGANGFVLGCLQENGLIHLTQNEELVQLAHPLPCTFHRAFDEIQNKELALNQIKDMGFANLLTAGQAGNAIDGLAVLQKLEEQAQGSICIIAAGGIRSENAGKIIRETGLSWIHSAAIISGEEADAAEIASLLQDCQKA